MPPPLKGRLRLDLRKELLIRQNLKVLPPSLKGRSFVTYCYESFGKVFVDPSSLCSEVLLRSLRFAKLRLRLRFAQDDTQSVRNSLTLIAEGIKIEKGRWRISPLPKA